MIIHKGVGIPQFSGKYHPDDVDWVWFSWSKKLHASSITATSWTIPNSWQIVSQTQVTSVTDVTDGITYTAAFGVLLNAPSTASGINTITNHVWFADSRYLNRSVLIDVQGV